MSNRRLSQSSALAALKLSHERQIAVCLDRSLVGHAFIDAFADAAGFSADERQEAHRFAERADDIRSVWCFGMVINSLFADLPGCKCPVIENHYGRGQGPLYELIPQLTTDIDRFNEAQLRAFAAIQQEARE